MVRCVAGVDAGGATPVEASSMRNERDKNEEKRKEEGVEVIQWMARRVELSSVCWAGSKAHGKEGGNGPNDCLPFGEAKTGLILVVWGRCTSYGTRLEKEGWRDLIKECACRQQATGHTAS